MTGRWEGNYYFAEREPEQPDARELLRQAQAQLDMATGYGSTLATFRAAGLLERALALLDAEAKP